MSALSETPSRETLKDTDRYNGRETRCKIIWCISLLSHCYIKRVPSWEAARNVADFEAVLACARRILSVLCEALESSMDDGFDITMFADLVAPVITMLSDSPCGRELVTAELVELLEECVERTAMHTQPGLENSGTWLSAAFDEAQAALEELRSVVWTSINESHASESPTVQRFCHLMQMTHEVTTYPITHGPIHADIYYPSQSPACA